MPAESPCIDLELQRGATTVRALAEHGVIVVRSWLREILR
jgi:hypothetical protein